MGYWRFNVSSNRIDGVVNKYFITFLDGTATTVDAVGFATNDGMVSFYRMVSTKGDTLIMYEGQTHKRQYFYFIPFKSLKSIILERELTE